MSLVDVFSDDFLDYHEAGATCLWYAAILEDFIVFLNFGGIYYA